MRRKNNEDGFTLIELIAVMSIISVLLCITAINLTGNQDLLLKKDAVELAQKIRYIQLQTILEKRMNHEYKIFVNYGDNPYQYKVYEPGKPVQIVKLDKGIRLTNIIEGNYVQFTAEGVPSHPGTLILKNSKNHEIDITIAFTAGRVWVSDIR